MNKYFGIGLLGLSLLLAGCGGSAPDTTKPTVTLVPVTTPVTTAGNVTITATATDNVAIRQVDFYDNGTLVKSVTAAPYTTTVTYSAADNGTTHTIKAVAVDTSGQSAESSQPITISIPVVPADTTKPTVTLDINPMTINSNAWTSVTVSGMATDDIGIKVVTLALDVNGKVFNLGNITPDSKGLYSYTITPATLGTQASLLNLISSLTVTAHATDTSGNTSAVVSKILTITH